MKVVNIAIICVFRLRGEEVLLGPWNGLARVKGVGKVMEGRRRGQNWMLRSTKIHNIRLFETKLTNLKSCVSKTVPGTKTLRCCWSFVKSPNTAVLNSMLCIDQGKKSKGIEGELA